MTLRFSANLDFLWPDRPLLERIDAAADAGFRAIELHWPYDTPAREVRARCERHGLTLLGINTVRGNPGENGLGALAGREAEFQAAVDQSIAYCLEAGGTAVHCMAGFVPPQAREEARRVFTKNLREASGKAAPHGLTLLLEALNPRDAPGYFYATQAEAARVLEEVGRPNIKLMFDVYHVGVSEGDILGKLAHYMPIIGHVQIAAVPSRAEPDEGEIDYRAVFAGLDTLGYESWVGAEYKPRAGTDEGLVWTQGLGVNL
jgi:hydroxypyruvate isomerase